MLLDIYFGESMCFCVQYRPAMELLGHEACIQSNSFEEVKGTGGLHRAGLVYGKSESLRSTVDIGK